MSAGLRNNQLIAIGSEKLGFLKAFFWPSFLGVESCGIDSSAKAWSFSMMSARTYNVWTVSFAQLLYVCCRGYLSTERNSSPGIHTKKMKIIIPSPSKCRLADMMMNKSGPSIFYQMILTEPLEDVYPSRINSQI